MSVPVIVSVPTISFARLSSAASLKELFLPDIIIITQQFRACFASICAFHRSRQDSYLPDFYLIFGLATKRWFNLSMSCSPLLTMNPSNPVLCYQLCQIGEPLDSCIPLSCRHETWFHMKNGHYSSSQPQKVFLDPGFDPENTTLRLMSGLGKIIGVMREWEQAP